MARTLHPNSFSVNLSVGERGEASNGITLSGWSDAGAVVTFPDIEPYADIRQGLDGPVRGTLRTGFGGDVTFEFISDSPSVQWFQERLSDLHNEQDVVIQGTVINNSSGETCNLIDGLLRVARAFPNFGTDGTSAMTFTVRFTDITTNYANFRPTVIELSN